MSPWLFLTTAAILAVVFSIAFSLPARFESMVKVVSPNPTPRYHNRAFWSATMVSTVALITMEAVDFLGANLPQGAPGVLWLAIATAGLMDLIADAGARYRNENLVAVWPLHRVQLTEIAIDALAQHGIDAHTQGLYFRKLFHFFAPFVPHINHGS